MNLKEIVNRPTKFAYNNEEMQFVVESYIKDKTGKSVDINLTKGLNKSSVMFIPMYQNQCVKLMEAFCVAQNYYKQWRR